MTIRDWRTWLILAGGMFTLAGLVWLGVVLFPLMSWDVYETGRLFIVGLISGLVATYMCNTRAYAKGRAVGYQAGHDNGWQRGYDAAKDFYVTDYHVSKEPGTTHLMAGSRFPGSRIYTTE
jgi:hypothetical protein